MRMIQHFMAKKILRLRRHPAQVVELEVQGELALGAHEALHRVIEPVRARACRFRP